ncbi:MAG TPA: hypothetical protein VMY78_02535 [Solirubrobacteraceae bacterium]|nr:hypothetical protein [Solirubrobacteraceae bacterium]
MSRHAIALTGGRELVVGWDPPLQTFFAIVRAPEQDQPELWVGTDLHELYELDDLARALGRAELAHHLTPELGLALERDREENRA